MTKIIGTFIIGMLVFSAALFYLTANANATHNKDPKCTRVQEDVDHLAKVLKDRSALGKVWLWEDTGYSITIAASPLFPPGKVILSFYDAGGCLIPNVYTGSIRTQVPVKDKIKSYIAKSKLLWSNTDKVLLTSAGLPV